MFITFWGPGRSYWIKYIYENSTNRAQTETLDVYSGTLFSVDRLAPLLTVDW